MDAMQYTQNCISRLLPLLRRDEKWLIIMNADPDAIASGQALKRLLVRRTAKVSLARVNDIRRPDNLAMLHYLRIGLHKLTPDLLSHYQRFALVDSQPHHHPSFAGINFSVVIDHHPTVPEFPVEAEFTDIRPEYGALSTLMTEYLLAMNIKPGKLLATALLYGIRTDTGNFSRGVNELDLLAYSYLIHLADNIRLSSISRSELRMAWIKYLTNGFESLRPLGKGRFSFAGQVPTADILVIIADVLMRVHEFRWVAVAGVINDHLVVILRSDGSRDMGQMAERLFMQYGPAGGQKSKARAEMPLLSLNGQAPDDFVYSKLKTIKSSRKPKTPT